MTTTYRATVDIYAGPHVCAYRVGDVVPASAVENLGVKDKVASETSKAGKAATAKATDSA